MAKGVQSYQLGKFTMTPDTVDLKGKKMFNIGVSYVNPYRTDRTVSFSLFLTVEEYSLEGILKRTLEKMTQKFRAETVRKMLSEEDRMDLRKLAEEVTRKFKG
jgi:hypothetical protein